MGLRVSPEELAVEWSLSFTDLDFVNAKPAGSRSGLAVQLKFFAANGFFATAATEVPEEAVSYLADQPGVGKTDLCPGKQPLVASTDGYITMGGEDEAAHYVEEYGKAWQGTHGAIKWLVETTRRMEPRARRNR